jgi:arylsulfatase
VTLDGSDAEGVLFAHGGVAGGHSLYVKDRRLHYVFNWVGTTLQSVTSDREVTAGAHVFTAEFAATGPSSDPSMPGAAGTLTLYMDDQAVGTTDIVTQPGNFCLVGDGLCVGRDSASPVTPDYADRGAFAFTGGVIDRVVVDVSGDRYVDHEAQVRAWFSID